jgi:hypothetical protein
MVKIFINYRRGDTIATAGRLYDRLAKLFGRGNIFMDVDHIPAGVDFVGHLEKEVAACDVLLALIGQSWLSAQNKAGQRRIDDPRDFVVLELASALDRKIPLIPVLIDGASMPSESELPEALKALSRRNAVEVRNSQFGSDVDRLAEKIRSVTGTGRSPRRWMAIAATIAVLAAGAGASYLYQRRDTANVTPRIEPKSAAGSLVPAVASYCAEAKRVVAAVDTRFESLLGREFGNNRIATLALPNWEDCVVFMENKFVEKRHYACSIEGFADLASAEKATDEAAAALKADCLGKGWVVERSFETDGKRRTRVLSGGSKTVITFAPSRPPTAPAWRLSVNVE